jgi:DNA polymerase-4
VTVRVRFADLHAVTRSLTLDAPISATAILAEIAEELVRTVLADHPDEKIISLLAISVSHLENHWDVQLERTRPTSAALFGGGFSWSVRP